MGTNTSREHHWWPVGVQKYWADKQGDISWIEPDGTIQRKRVRKRKIAYKSHGHTMLRGSVWQTNFEDEFSEADNGAPKVIDAALKLQPLGSTIPEFVRLMKLLLKRDRTLRDMCKFSKLDEPIHRGLLLLIFSILLRSPANRSRFESYSTLAGLPPNEEVGKANMRQNYQIAKKLCQTGFSSNQYFCSDTHNYAQEIHIRRRQS